MSLDMVEKAVPAPEHEDVVPQLLEVVRARTGLPLAWMSRFVGGDQVLEVLSGAAERFGLAEGARAPLEGSYCRRVLTGELPAVIPDTAQNPVTAALEVTHAFGLGAYVGAPILDVQGHPVGMLCAVSDGPSPLGEPEHQAVALAAEMLSKVIASGLAASTETEELVERIRDEIDNARLVTVFQPIVEFARNAVVGVEALARFSRQPFRPDRWFADAELCGLGVDLEVAAIGVALSHLDELPPDVYLSVNASPATITDPRFADALTAVPLDRMVVEITEHAAIDDYPLLTATLSAMRACGLRVAADDVGSGFASFTHVLELKPDILKIDRSIVRSVDTDPARRSLVHAVTKVGEQIGATVVAEGVETREELGALAALGVSVAQGYVLARPGPLPLPTFSVPRVEVATAEVEAPTDDSGVRHPFELALQHSPIGKCLVGLDGSFLQVNPALARMLGYTTTELTEMTFQELTHPEDLGADLDLLGACLRGERVTYRIDKRYRRCDGTYVWGDLSVVLVRDEADDPLYFISQIVDVTDRRQREDARIDPVTHAQLRSRTIDHVVRMLTTDAEFGIVLVELSGLGEVNRRAGIEAGDRELSRVADAIGRVVRPEDSVGRWSGSSFLVVSPAPAAHHLHALAERIGRELARLVDDPMGWSVRHAHRDGRSTIDELLAALDTPAVRDGVLR